MDKAVVLQIAIHNHLELDIIYAGGSQPGTARRILPTALSGGIVKARCQGAAKSFKVDLIQIPHIVQNQPFRNYSGIQDILLLEQRDILASGLIAEADRFHLTLYQEDRRPVLSIRRKDGCWWVRDQRYTLFQPAAEAFILALRMRSMNGK